MTTESVLAFATPIAIIIAAVIQQLNNMKANRERAEVKEKVEAVKVAVSEETTKNAVKLESIAKTAESVHILVNSSMSSQMKISSVALRRLADITKHNEDVVAAELAERLYKEHEYKQREVDDKVGLKAAPVH